jgi:hypothetical protein
MEMTIEQQRAMAAASARARAAEAERSRPVLDERPWYSKLGEAADDTARLVADSATFGLADRLAGRMGGEGLEAERAKTRAASDRAGWAGTAAQVIGALGPLGAASKVVRSLPGVSSAVQLGGKSGLAARTGAAAVEGAGFGAADAAGHDQDIAEGAKWGAVAGAAGNVAGEAASKVVDKTAGLFNKKPNLPDTDEIFARGRAAYDRAEQAGVVIGPQGIQALATDIKTMLANNAYDPALAPKIKVVLDRLDDMSQGNVTLKGVDTLRKIAGAKINPANRYESMLSGEVTRRIDDFLDNLSPNNVVMGNAAQGAEALKEARFNWAQGRKSDMLDEAVERAVMKTQSTGSGGNINNALRQEFRAILTNKKRSSGLTPDESAAMHDIVKGTDSANLARLVGKLSPQGNGLMMTIHGVGALESGGMTLPAALAGGAAKSYADRATSKNVEGLARIIQNGGMNPAVKNAVQRLAQSERDALSRLLAGVGVVSMDGGAAAP